MFNVFCLFHLEVLLCCVSLNGYWRLFELTLKLIFSLDYRLIAELLGVDFDVEFLINA